MAGRPPPSSLRGLGRDGSITIRALREDATTDHHFDLGERDGGAEAIGHDGGRVSFGHSSSGQSARDGSQGPGLTARPRHLEPGQSDIYHIRAGGQSGAAAPIPLLVDRQSGVGNPFAFNHSSERHRACLAFDELLRVIFVLARAGCIPPQTAAAPRAADPAPGDLLIMERIAARHAVGLAPGAHLLSLEGIWSWLSYVSRLRAPLHLYCHCRDEIRGTPMHDCHAQSLVGAIRLLQHGGASIPSPPALRAGNWPVSDICRRFSSLVARELAGFDWPLRTAADVERLLGCPHAAPTDLVGCEFTGAVRDADEAETGRVVLSVDSREALTAGPHAVIDLRLVLGLTIWHHVFLFPPCTHQVLSDTRAGADKRLDGRSFWGIAFFIYCWCVRARMRMMEQPNTIIPDYYLRPRQTLRPW